MKVPLTAADFLRRAELVYPDRIGLVDEPDQPAAPWDALTYREMAERAQAQAAALDELGVGQGERVAVVSHNSARLLTSFYGVSGYGRILVPVNFRLNADEVAYIVEHSGASVLMVDPEVDAALAGVTAKHRFVLGAESDEELYRYGVEPVPWDDPDEEATATINYTSGTTARPKGVQLTHRNVWINAATFGWQMGVDDRDVYLHTLPQFHCNGWGMVYAVTGMGARHIVLRKVDGAEILRRVAEHGVTLLCGAPAVVAMILEAAQTWDGPIPGRDRVRMVVAGAPPPTRTIERMETELGWEFTQIYGLTETAPLLTMNRRRAEFDDLTPYDRAARLGRAGHRHPDRRRRLRRGAGQGQRHHGRLLGAAGRDRGRDGRRLVPHRRRRPHRRRQLPDDLRPQEGCDHLGGRERQLDRGRGRSVLPPGRRRGRRHRRARRAVGRGGEGTRRAGPGGDGH
jgi:acyl-CoA synthetase (AMP-forming)/AMP-acid ligase II